jgi:hypothetical protein
MKLLIKKLLREYYDINDGTYIAYHGSPHKITKFSDMFVGGDKAKDQEGPGIYFTTSSDEAMGYAGDNGYVYKVELSVKKLLSNERDSKLNRLSGSVTKLIKAAPNWKRVARGYDDDVEEGLSEMVHRYIGMSNSEKEVFISVFMDVYRSEPVSYVKNMVKLGYSGVYLPTKNGGAHIVIYSPSSIKIIESNQIKG